MTPEEEEVQEIRSLLGEDAAALLDTINEVTGPLLPTAAAALEDVADAYQARGIARERLTQTLVSLAVTAAFTYDEPDE